ncbi:MAG TPA: 3-dehydroquinate synthase, partial [Spirochaetota bacterium]|nr:3-dehydroquinate synthase [Spirochaetota bacterium]
KTRETKSMLEDAMFHNQHDRKTLVIALGGGVTGDLAGYLAATYMRGVPFVQIPTSLLAQVDSSVGGKTGVDVPAGKNLVGAFWQPSGVYIDPNLLSTLPEREYLSGLGEIVKHALMFSPEMIHLLEHGQHPIMERDPLMMADLVAKNCTIKAGVVSADETESGLRRTLNFGHTVAHAIELASGYSVSHGVAVMAGILVEVRAAVLSGLLSEESATAMGTTVMRYLHNPPGIQNFDPDTMVQAMLLDKKNTEGAIHCSLPEAPGIPPDCTWTRAFSEEILKAALRDVFLPTGG